MCLCWCILSAKVLAPMMMIFMFIFMFPPSNTISRSLSSKTNSFIFQCKMLPFEFPPKDICMMEQKNLFLFGFTDMLMLMCLKYASNCFHNGVNRQLIFNNIKYNYQIIAHKILYYISHSLSLSFLNGKKNYIQKLLLKYSNTRTNKIEKIDKNLRKFSFYFYKLVGGSMSFPHTL